MGLFTSVYQYNVLYTLCAFNSLLTVNE